MYATSAIGIFDFNNVSCCQFSTNLVIVVDSIDGFASTFAKAKVPISIKAKVKNKFFIVICF